MAAVVLTGCDRLRSVDSIVARGEQQFQNGNFRAALGDFKTALERDSEHVQARVAMARTLLLLGDFDGANTAIDAAIKRGAVDGSAIALKYDTLLWLGQFATVLKESPNESALSEPQKWLLAARAHAGLQQHQEAETAIERVLAQEPTNEAALVLAANLRAQRSEYAQANQLLDRALAANQKSAAVLFAKGRVALALGDLVAAKVALESAEELGNRVLNWREQGQLYALLAEIALVNRDAEAATGWLDAMNARISQSVLGLYMRARLALLKDNPDEAIGHLQRAVLAGEYPPAQLLLAGIQISKANYGQAETQLNRLLAQNSNNPEARKLLAQIYLATNRVAEAAKVLPVDDTAVDPQLDWLRGQTLFASGAQTAGIELLEKSFAANRTDVPRGLQLARAYVMAGQRDKATALLDSLPAEAGGAQRQGLMVLASVVGKSREEGNKEIDMLLARHADDSMLHAAAGSLLGQLGDYTRATELLNKSIALDDKNIEARMALASVYFAGRRYDQAEEQLRAVIGVDTKHAAAYSNLARVALARGDKTQTVKYLEQAIGADPSAVEPRLQLARLAFADRDLRRAGSLLDEAIIASQERPAVLNAAGVLLFQAQQYDDALRRFDRAAAGGDVQAKFNAARVELALDRRPDARRRLTILAADRDTQEQAVAALAKLDVEDGRIDLALNRATELRRRPDSAAAGDELEGDIYAATKQWAKAAASFDRANRRSASQRLALKRFQIAAASGRADAVEPLRDWIKRTPRDFATRKVLAKFYTAKGQTDLAIQEYESWLRDSGVRDPEMLNDLAWLYGEKGDDRALGLAREAYEGLRDSPEIADTYGWLLLGRGNVKEALQILESAAKVAKGNPEIQYHYAAALVRAEDRQRAQGLLKDTLAAHRQFPSRERATSLLQSIEQ